MTLLASLAFCVVVLIATWVFSKREGYYSTVLVFGIGSFIYYVAIPLEVSIFGNNVPIAGYSLRMDTPLQIQIVCLAILALIGFSSGLWLTRMRILPLPVDKSTDVSTSLSGTSAHTPRSLIFMFLGSVLFIVVGFRELVVQSGVYASAYMIAYENSMFSYFLKVGYLILTAIGAVLICKKKYWGGVIALALVGFWGVFSSSKDPLVLAVLGVASMTIGRSSRRPYLIGVVSLCALGLALVGSIAFSQFRAGVSITNVNIGAAIANRGMFRQIDPAGPMVSIVKEVGQNDPKLQYGRSWANGLFLWVPRFIWESRPLDLAQQFAQSNLEGWLPGQGLGYSPLAESYINFGWAGALMQYFLIGILWGVGWRIARIPFRVFPNYVWTSIYGTIGFYLLVTMHRGAFSATITSFLQIVLPLVVLTILLDRLRLTPKVHPREPLNGLV